MKKEICLDELKVLQLDIMSSIHRFCEEYQLRYSLSCGSMLGAARHKGYIPWDDDIDIYLLREDYNIMVQNFPDLWEGKYKFCTLERDLKWGLPYGKVCDTRTILKEGATYTHELGVNIDVFPIDKVPDDDKLWEKYDAYRRKCYTLYSTREYMTSVFSFNNGKPFLENLLTSLMKICFHLISVRNMAKWYQNIAIKYNKTNSSRVFECVQGIFLKKPFPITLFDNRVLMPFEDRKYMCFADYETYLTTAYGDWRQLPAEEKQISHHNFKAWWKE